MERESQQIYRVWCCTWTHIPSVHYAQKTVAFHFEYGSEVFENARYEMQTLYSMDNLQHANQSLGRIDEIADH